MHKYYKIINLILLNCILFSINNEYSFCENTNTINENTNTINENTNTINENTNTINENKLLISSIIIVSMLLIYLFIFNINLNYDIEELYRISVEISNTCTVKGWEIIHQILKDLDPSSSKDQNIHQILKIIKFTVIPKQDLIEILENLITMDKENPNIFSVNSIFFEKSVKKLIEFLKNI